MQPLRQDLLELALDYYQEFIDERGEDPELEADLAAAYYRAGEIATALGDETEAQSAHQKALNMRIALANKDPKNTVMRNALAESYISLGRFESTHIDSIDYLTKAIEMAKPLVNPKHRATLVRAYLYLGVMKRRHFRNDGGTEKMEQARTALENAVDVLGELKEDHPEDHQPRLLSEVYTELGTWHQMMGNQDEVKSYDRRTLEISKELVEKEPDNLEHQHTLAGHHANVGEDEKSIKIFEKLANENPSVVLYQGDLAKAYAKLGAIRRTRESWRSRLRSTKDCPVTTQNRATSQARWAHSTRHLAICCLRLAGLTKQSPPTIQRSLLSVNFPTTGWNSPTPTRGSAAHRTKPATSLKRSRRSEVPRRLAKRS